MDDILINKNQTVKRCIKRIREDEIDGIKKFYQNMIKKMAEESK